MSVRAANVGKSASNSLKPSRNPQCSAKTSDRSKNNSTSVGARSKQSNYDTLDSAYSTCESSYNTVDSSYSQQSLSSGYDTLELKCTQSRTLQRIQSERDENRRRIDPVSSPIAPVVDQLRYVDDIDDSDTATETETDTDQHIASQPTDMSYVPDYIRSVPLVSTSSSGATSNHSAPTSSLTTLSTASSVSSSSSATTHTKDVASSKLSALRRVDRNLPQTEYRGDYYRKQKEKLCGRKSLDERLKSLETDASVKLQVCKRSQYRRQKSIDRELEANTAIHASEPPSSNVTREGKAPKEKDGMVEVALTRAPPPDIIESHQPPSRVEQLSVASVPDKKKPGDNNTDEVPLVRSGGEKEHHHTEKSSQDDGKMSSSTSFPTSTKSQLEVPCNTRIPSSSHQRSSKLRWRPPSQEALNKLHSSLPHLPTASDLDLEKSSNPPQILIDDDVTPKVTKDLIQQSEEEATPLVVDIAVDDAVVPVELRSPRHDGESRSTMKEKRNARMFVFPASDESENDGHVMKNQDDNENNHTSPVKFIPSVLRRLPDKSAGGDADAAPNTSPPPVSNEKTAEPHGNLKPRHQQKILQPIRRSSSSKRSSHQERTSKHSRTRSSGSQSPPPITTSSARYSKPSEFDKSRNHKNRNRRSKPEYSELTVTSRPSSRRVIKDSSASLVSPRQQVVAQAVIGMTANEREFPYIDDATNDTDERLKPAPADSRERSSSDGALLQEADSATMRRAFPLSRKGRSSRRKEGPRRVSYMEAMESSEDLTPDPDQDPVGYRISEKEEGASFGKLGRSTSVDSILSSNVETPREVVLRRRNRANSEDRGSLKKSHRRSYQIATNKSVDPTLARQPHKRQPSIRRLKSFFENTQTSNDMQTTEGRRTSRGRSLDPLPALILNESDGDVAREGFLHFKVATIERGKRTSAQKSWKLVWVVMKGPLLYLCRDWGRSKSEPAPNDVGVSADQTPPGSVIPLMPPPSTQLVLEEEEPLNIQASLVSIAYNYVKRKNVFRLTTCNGSEYLFQAEDREDMLAWIDAVQNRGNRDDKEEVLINKDLILRKSSQVELGTISFVGIKKIPTDPCILCSVRPVEESFTTYLPRCYTGISTTKPRRIQSSSGTYDLSLVMGPPLGDSPPSSPSDPTLRSSSIPCERCEEEPMLSGSLSPSHSSPNEDAIMEDVPMSTSVDGPIGAVVRRVRGAPSGGTQKRNRRRGVVWSGEGSKQKGSNHTLISHPIPISNPNQNSDHFRSEPRSTEEQHDLLRQLSEAQIVGSPPVDQHGDSNNNEQGMKSHSIAPLKDNSQSSRHSSAKGKMAVKIQRTIRALYDGTKRSSFDKLEEEEDCVRSSEDELDEKGVPLIVKSKASSDSPKPEKRATRKSRSPKPPRRLGVPVKDVDGSRRFKWRGSVNRIVKKFGQGHALLPGSTFDAHLEDCPPSTNNELVPFVVDLCCRIVEEKGLDFTGIYRVPGNSGTLVALQEDLNLHGMELDVENDPRLNELNVVSSLLKSFFRKLPDPLFSNELYDDFITINRKKEPEERLNGLRRLIHMLPAPHYETLKFLITHLCRVADHSDTNKMEIRNLAIVFGPTLVRSTVSDNMATMVTDMSDQCRIVESVLQHAEWFFSGDKSKSPCVETPPVSKEDIHEPVPSIDHLLANVGRTQGECSDQTSDSSKSKVSNTSEKDSFSRDVFELIFGAGKRWLQQSNRPPKEEGSSSDEFGFKEAERKHARASTEPSKSPPKAASNPTPRKYQVSKPAASGIRAAWPSRGRPSPSDISARLYDYYLENIDRTNRNLASRGNLYPTSSSNESSPMPTPRTSGYQPPPVQRSYALQPRRAAEAKPAAVRLNAPLPSPRSAQQPHDEHPRTLKKGEDASEMSRYLNNEPSKPDEDTDSDSSIYVGETLEEKLKNLTNLDKKLERRPSRRHRPNVVIKVSSPPNQAPKAKSNKKMSAPSVMAGEVVTPGNLKLLAHKKTTHEIYRERKHQRQQHRDMVRARRIEPAISPATSDENLLKRSDPRRQLLRSNAHEDSTRTRRLRSTGEKVRRRHTLGGSDFPDHEHWQESQYNSMQNVAQDPNSAMARLRPQLGSSTPFLRNLSTNPVYPSNGTGVKKSEKFKIESYL